MFAENRLGPSNRRPGPFLDPEFTARPERAGPSQRAARPVQTSAGLQLSCSIPTAETVYLRVFGVAHMCGCKPWLSISRSRSAMYRINSIGPITDPCGTPHMTSASLDLLIPQRTNYVRPSRYEANQLKTAPPRPYDTSSRRSSVKWSTVSKAADRYSNVVDPGYDRSKTLRVT